MSCENVSIEYPSAKLIPIVNAAIEFQTGERDLLWERMKKRVTDYESLHWFKRLFVSHPDKGLLCDNWQDDWSHSQRQHNLKELKAVLMCAESADTVRMTGACLAKIDNWAGN